MTVAPAEPSEDPVAEPDNDEPDKAPDLPDPAFPEVLPGGGPGPGSPKEPARDQRRKVAEVLPQVLLLSLVCTRQ